MSQKGIVSPLILIIIIAGLVLGVYFVDQSTGFISKALDSNPSAPRSAIIKIATSSAHPKLATDSAKPATASAKPSQSATSSASPSASASARPAK